MNREIRERLDLAFRIGQGHERRGYVPSSHPDSMPVEISDMSEGEQSAYVAGRAAIIIGRGTEPGRDLCPLCGEDRNHPSQIIRGGHACNRR